MVGDAKRPRNVVRLELLLEVASDRIGESIAGTSPSRATPSNTSRSREDVCIVDRTRSEADVQVSEGA